MSRIVLSFIAALSLAACTTGGGRGVEPIPGSITYGGQPRTKLTKAPIGSTFEHTFRDNTGRPMAETYRIQPDRSLLLLERHVQLDNY